MNEDTDSLYKELVDLVGKSEYATAKEMILNKLLPLVPNSSTLFYTLGTIYYSENDLEKALRFYKYNIAVDPSDKLYDVLHNVFYELILMLGTEHFNFFTEEKLKYAYAGLKINPTSVEILTALSCIYLNLEDNARSEYFDRINIYLNHNYTRIIHRIHNSLFRQGKSHEVLHILRHIINPETRHILLSALVRQLRFNDALVFFRSLMNSGKIEEVNALIDYAYLEYMIGDIQTAIEILQEILAKENNNRRAMFILGKIHETLGDLEKALEYYRTLSEIDDIHDYDVYMAIVAIEKNKLKQDVSPEIAVDGGDASGLANSHIQVYREHPANPDIICYGYTTHSGSHYTFSLLSVILEEMGYVLMSGPLDYSVYIQSMPANVREKAPHCNNSFYNSWIRKTSIDKCAGSIVDINAKAIFVTRDPRDIISRIILRQKKDEMGMDEFFDKVLYFVIKRYKIQLETYFNNPVHYLVKYENLRKDCSATLMQLCHTIDLKVPDEVVQLAIESTNFKKIKSYSKPTDSYLYKAKTDYWQQFRDTAVYSRMKEEFSDILIRLNYEENYDW